MNPSEHEPGVAMPEPPPGTTLTQAEAMARLIEAAHQVRRRYQFFVWAQSHLQAFVPHRVAVCGAYQRNRKALALEVFNSVPLPPAVEAMLVDADAPIMRALLQRWAAQGGRPLLVSLAAMDGASVDSRKALLSAGLDTWLVHAVARPQRPHELESAFLFCSPGAGVTPRVLQHCGLLLPQIHAAYLRVQETERELGLTPPGVASRKPAPGTVTPRERQILSWVREGLSNQQIGEALGISPLTVKNHVQKILRKLDAANRAQAVAKAMALDLLPNAPPATGGVEP